MVFILVNKEKHISPQPIKIRELQAAKNISLLLPVPLVSGNQTNLPPITKCLPEQLHFSAVGITLWKEKPTKEVIVSLSPRVAKTIEKKFFDFLI